MSGLQDLTAHLLQLHADTLARATQHPFLRAAGSGTLPTRKLREWLAQDVHYTRGYVRFIGGLMSRLKLEWAVLEGPATAAAEDGRATALQHRVFGLLTDALVNIRREMAFFQEVDEKYGLGVTEQGEIKRVRATRGYVELFEQWTSSAGTHHWQPLREDEEHGGTDEQLLYGLVCLWATEMCYLRAWSFAGQVMGGEAPEALEKTKSGAGGEDAAAATAALQEALIPNWSSREFAKFVGECASVADAVGRAVDSTLSQASEAKKTVVAENCRSVYLSVLELEEGFWPSSRRYSTEDGN